MKYKIDNEKVIAWVNESAYYSTDDQGHGIFFVDLIRNTKKQLTGTCQFSVFGLKPESKKAKLRKWLTERN